MTLSGAVLALISCIVVLSLENEWACEFVVELAAIELEYPAGLESTDLPSGEFQYLIDRVVVHDSPFRVDDKTSTRMLIWIPADLPRETDPPLAASISVPLRMVETSMVGGGLFVGELEGLLDVRPESQEVVMDVRWRAKSARGREKHGDITERVEAEFFTGGSKIVLSGFRDAACECEARHLSNRIGRALAGLISSASDCP